MKNKKLKSGNVISFDPGRKTGYTKYLVDHNYNIHFLDYETLDTTANANNILNIIDFAIKDLNNNDEMSYIVVEGYRANIRTKDQLHAAYLVGTILNYCAHSYIPVTENMPSVRKGYVNLSESILKKTLKVDKINKTNYIHIIDSGAHALHFINNDMGVELNVRI